MTETRARFAPRLLATLLSTLAVTLTITPVVAAQAWAPVEHWGTMTPIPPLPFKTWSLFLVTNPNWLMPSNASRLKDLYDRFKAFGRTIGQDHAAVWFWKEDKPLDGPDLAANVDVERAISYCQKLKLKPGNGPYLLFTTFHPDEPLVPAGILIFELGDKTADEIGRLLTALGDQLVTEGVVWGGRLQAGPMPDDFWSAWFDATRHTLMRVGMKVRFLIRTPSFTIDGGLTPGAEG